MNQRAQNRRPSGLSGILFHLCLIGLLVTALSANRAVAQMDEGAIVGVVTDSAGAAIPSAQVTVTDTLTGLVLTTKTNSTGDYFFAPIKTGNYTIRASAPNFETTEQDNIVVHVTDRLNIPLSLKPGNVSTTVTVTSAASVRQ